MQQVVASTLFYEWLWGNSEKGMPWVIMVLSRAKTGWQPTVLPEIVREGHAMDYYGALKSYNRSTVHCLTGDCEGRACHGLLWCSLELKQVDSPLSYRRLWGKGMPWVMMVLSRATTGRCPMMASDTSSDRCNKSETITHLVRSHKNNTVCSNILNQPVSWRKFTWPTSLQQHSNSSGT